MEKTGKLKKIGGRTVGVELFDNETTHGHVVFFFSQEENHGIDSEAVDGSTFELPPPRHT